MRTSFTSLACALMLSTSAMAQIGGDIEKAEQLIAANKFSDALRIVEVTFRKQGLPRLAVLKLYELQGVCAAQLGQNAKAKTAFQSLLQLDPKRELPKNAAARAGVKAAFRDAKAWAEDSKGAMDFIAASPLTDEQGKVVQIAAKVKNDALKLARKVRFHLKVDGGVWTELDMEVAASFSSAATDANTVDWWAELLGDREAVLASLGSERNPIHNQGKGATPVDEEKPVAVAAEPVSTPAPLDEPEDPVKPEPRVEEPSTVVLSKEPESGRSSSSALKPVAYGLWGAGAVAAGVGAYFGMQSSNARSRVTGAIINAGNGPVTELSQAEAYQLDKQSQGDALKANVLFGTAAGLAVAGGICFWLGLDDDGPVAVAPMLNGAVLVGTW